jgi:DNA-binding transcriptional LysR family regulator
VDELSDWNLLTTFLTFADEPGLTEAAARLAISPRTLMRRIRRLEGKLGVGLVAPGAGRPTLTSAGLRLRDEASPRLNDLRRVLRDTRQDARSRTLRFAISTDLPADWIQLINAWFANRGEPASLKVEPPDEALRMLRRSQLDVILIAGEPDDTPQAVVGHEPTLAVFPADHPAADQAAIQPGDLLGLPVAVSEAATDLHRRLTVEQIQGDPDLPYVVAPRIGTIGQGLIHAVRTHGAVALTLAHTFADADTTGLVARPLEPPHEIAVTLIGRPSLPDAALRPLADYLTGVPGPVLPAVAFQCSERQPLP